MKLSPVNLTLFIVLLLFSCKKKQYTDADVHTKQAVPFSILEGNWYAKIFVDTVALTKSPLQAIFKNDPFYAYAFQFSLAKPDSVLIYNGFEEPYALPIKIKNDTVVAYNARPNASLFLIFNPIEQTLTSVEHLDTIWAKNTYARTNVFALDAYHAFEIELNEKVFDGVFEATFPANLSTTLIRFLPDGTLLGLKGFDKYHLCTIGDCFVGDDEIDVIEFQNSTTNKSVFYGFQFSEEGKNLSIYDFNPSKLNEKGVNTIKDLKYRLSKKTVGTVE